MAFRDLMDRIINWSGGTYVGLSTLVVLGLAISEFISGVPTTVVGADGKVLVLTVHKAPEWFVSAIGVYTIILGAFAISKPVNALIAQKGNAGITPPASVK